MLAHATRSRSIKARRPKHDGFCRSAIEPSRQTYYVLSCNCATCSDCLVDEHAKRGPFQLRCRCKRVVTSHRIMRRPYTASCTRDSEPVEAAARPRTSRIPSSSIRRTSCAFRRLFKSSVRAQKRRKATVLWPYTCRSSVGTRGQRRSSTSVSAGLRL